MAAPLPSRDRRSIPIACTLTTKEAAGQLLEWSDLQSRAREVQSLPQGVRMTFPPELELQVRDLAAREATCCAFLDITTTILGPDLVLEIRSDDPEALPVIAAIAGTTVER